MNHNWITKRIIGTYRSPCSFRAVFTHTMWPVSKTRKIKKQNILISIHYTLRRAVSTWMLKVSRSWFGFRLLHRAIERFSMKRRKTKVITILTNHKRIETIQRTNKKAKQIHEADAKRGKTGVCSRLLLSLLIGWKSGASFFKPIAWRSNVKPKQMRLKWQPFLKKLAPLCH